MKNERFFENGNGGNGAVTVKYWHRYHEKISKINNYSALGNGGNGYFLIYTNIFTSKGACAYTRREKTRI